MAEKQEDLELVPSVDDDISAAIDKHAGKDFDPRPSDDDLEETLEAALDDSDTETVEEPESEEDDDAEDTDDEPDEDEADTDDEPEDESDDDESSDDESDLVAAPEHWPKDQREAFDKLPAEARDLVLAQNKHFERKNQGHAEDIREAAALREAFAPLEQELSLRGMDRIAAVRQTVASLQMLMKEPDQGLRFLAKSYGGNIRDKVGFVKSLAREMEVELPAGPDQPEPEYIDQTAKTAIDGLQREVAQLRKTQTDSTNAANEKQIQQAQAELVNFMEAKDDAGNLKHPHFQRVASVMGQMYQADPSRSLQDCYDAAVMIDPDLRAEMVKAEVEAKAAANGKAERQKRAKKASRNIKGKKVGTPNFAEMSVEETVRASADRYERRA